MGDGAGSLSVVVLCWHCLVLVCCHHLLVITCCGSLIALCPGHIIVRCYCCLITLHCCYTLLLGHHRAMSSSCGCTASVAHWGSMSPVSVRRCPGSQRSGLGQMWDGGYSLWWLKQQQRQMMTNVIIRCLVAMSQTVTWHLDFVLTSWLVRRGEFTHLG